MTPQLTVQRKDSIDLIVKRINEKYVSFEKFAEHQSIPKRPDSSYEIQLDIKHPIEVRRWYLAKEIAHFVLSHKNELPLGKREEQELEAKFFADCWLSYFYGSPWITLSELEKFTMQNETYPVA